MLLAVDVGNTNTVLGVYDGSVLLHDFRLESARGRTAHEYVVQVLSLLNLVGIARNQIKAAIIASVVPSITEPLERAVEMAFAVKALVVGPGLKSGMPILYENPKEVGADRIVNAVAAYERFHAALIVVDFGTATTFDCVSGKGEYLGGVITPGLMISAEALFSRAAKLSRIPIEKPAKVIGRNTQSSTQSGIVFGYAALVDGLVERIRAEYGAPMRVLATGGLASLICSETKHVELVDPNLTLEGLRLLYERNRS